MKQGFTLIELSIVLVIIGLIIGGVLVGKDLIRAAEIRAQIKQIDEFKIAVNTFKSKYNALPGDMPPSLAAQLGFFTFTGTYAGSACSLYAYGNNDGAINSYNEHFPFWSHLGDSKLIRGNYGGVSGNILATNTSGCGATAGAALSCFLGAPVGVCNPVSKINKKYTVGASANRFAAPSNVFILFGNTPKQNTFYINASTNQAYQLDIKIDNGYPASGDVRDYRASDFSGGINGHAPCTTLGTTPAITYDLNPDTADLIDCFPYFLW